MEKNNQSKQNFVLSAILVHEEYLNRKKIEEKRIGFYTEKLKLGLAELKQAFLSYSFWYSELHAFNMVLPPGCIMYCIV